MNSEDTFPEYTKLSSNYFHIHTYWTWFIPYFRKTELELFCTGHEPDLTRYAWSFLKNQYYFAYMHPLC